MPESAVYVLEKMAHGFSRLGGASGEGFYEHIDGEASLWPGLSVFTRGARKPVPGDLQDRLCLAVVLEALRSAHAPEQLPAEFGWVRSVIAQSDTSVFIERANQLAAAYGARFTPPASLPAWARNR